MPESNRAGPSLGGTGQATLWALRTTTDLVEQSAAELWTRWQRGERPLVEQLGPAYERLGVDVERLLDLIYHEILVREDFGERPEASEYARRFPQLADRIVRLLDVHRAVDAGGAVGAAGSDATFPENRSTPPSAAQQTGEEAVDPPRFDDGLKGVGARTREAGAASEFARRNLTAVADFELLQELGRGGMAVVYRARQRSLDRIVALKMLATNVVTEETLSRFRQEALAVAQLQHPNFVRVFEVGEITGRPYLALEYVSGGTLHARLDGRPLAPRSTAQLIETLARAIHYAHRRGVVHRDLKPANILLEIVDAWRKSRPDATNRPNIWRTTCAAFSNCRRSRRVRAACSSAAGNTLPGARSYPPCSPPSR